MELNLLLAILWSLFLMGVADPQREIRALKILIQFYDFHFRQCINSN